MGSHHDPAPLSPGAGRLSEVMASGLSRLRDGYRYIDATPPSHQHDTKLPNKMYYLYKSNSIPSSINSSAPKASHNWGNPGQIVDQDKPVDRFLKGSIPLELLETASCLPGKALAVYIALRHQCDLTGKTTVHLPPALLRSFGVSRDAKARALRVLEKAGLIQVQRTTGLAAGVTLNV